MAYNHRNILVGAADLYFAPLEVENETTPGTFDPVDRPAFTAGETARTAFEGDANWDHVGLTSGGVEVTYAPDFGEVEVDQWLDAALMYKQRQTVTVSTTFAEATLENLLFTWGQTADTLDAGEEADSQELRVSAGDLGDEPEERQLAFVGKGPRTGGTRRERVYHLERVLSVESSAHTLSRNDATTIPVSLRCLPQDAAGGSDYGVIIQRTLTA